MKFSLFGHLAAGVFLLNAAQPAHAQVPLNPAPAPAAADTLHKFEKPAGALAAAGRKPFFQRKLVRASLVPAVLIGYGLSTINGHGFYSSYQAKADIKQTFPNFRTTVDNYLQFVPYLELAGVALLKVETRDDRLNTLLLIGKSEAIMLASVYATKFITNIDRPNGASYAFPSGHTAQAFLAASIVHNKLRDKSQWYGIGAYAVATGVGALRMLNNKHWESDVFAGAGFGILSAHLAYLSHRNRWGRSPRLVGLNVAPAYFGGGTPGLTLSWRPK